MTDRTAATLKSGVTEPPPVPLTELAGNDTKPLAEAYALVRPTFYGSFLLALCVLVGMVEGYDVQAMSLAAPLLAASWQLSPQAVGSLLSASLIGQVVGGFLLAPLGDRIGRRPALLAGLMIAGTATYAGAYMADYNSMMMSRFIAGLGLGFALVNTLTLAMELAPNSWRTTTVVMVSSGYPLGAAAGAAAVGALLPIHGVAAVFYVGGVSTLFAFIICTLALPESPVMMVRKSNDQGGLRKLLRRLGVTVAPTVRLTVQMADAGKSNIAALFTPERRSTTLLLWVLNFSSLSMVYFFVMWLPSLFVHSGLDPQAAIRATAIFSFSGIIGGLTLATLLPRIGPIFTLGGSYILTAVAVAIFADLEAPDLVFHIVLFTCGFAIIGSQFCLHAVVNLFYPGTIRATGLGFALGAGRLGGVAAPIAGGFVLAAVASPQQAFYIALIPVAVSMLALFALRRLSLVGLHAE